jgi:MFS transporter, DHA1 family, multidrug resistance protein
MSDFIRETPVGMAIRFLSRNKLLLYPEEMSDFKLPSAYQILSSSNEKSSQESGSDRQHSDGLTTPDNGIASTSALPVTQENEAATLELGRVISLRNTALERTRSVPITPQKTSDGVILVDWYTTDDPANPKNWSSLKKSTVMFALCVYTFTVYCAGPTYSIAAELIQEHFGVSAISASLGLGLYVLAYGIGDLLFAPLSEIPIIGRNPVYWISFIVFWVLTFPEAVIDDFGSLLEIRFWLGFFGSPALANGGATAGDLFDIFDIPYGLSWWVLSAWAGPAFGPVIGGFAAEAKGWRWPMWEITWMASLALVVLLVLMPETSPQNILLRRAQRLRKLTGDSRLQSQSEIDQRNLKASEMLTTALIRPMEIMFKDPSIFFVNMYTGFFYGVFYTFFEVFPLVFPVMYGFSLSQTGLTFLSCLVGVGVALALYFAYLYFYMIPDNRKNGLREQEHRLVPAILGSFFITAGLFIFAWTSRSDVHWIAPLIGAGTFCIGHFFTMQSLFIYLPLSYPKYAASLFAGNSVWRSGIAVGSVAFARPLFLNLGVDKGVTLLGGVSVIGIFGTAAIYMFGKKLRARSKFAES